MIQDKNFSAQKLSDLGIIENNEIFERCNFSQWKDTNILSGITGLIFRECNLVNVNVPINSVIEKCNTTKINRCSNINPDVGLTECIENCEHVIDTDLIYVDGELIETVYYYKDIING